MINELGILKLQILYFFAYCQLLIAYFFPSPVAEL